MYPYKELGSYKIRLHPLRRWGIIMHFEYNMKLYILLLLLKCPTLNFDSDKEPFKI